MSNLFRECRVGIRSGGGRRHSLSDKLAARLIKQPSGCWEVQGCKSNRAGHVHLSTGSVAKGDFQRVLAHRFVWEQAHGPIPDGKVILHICDNPRCVNLSHLRLGTQRDNIIDSIHKGRYNTFGRQRLNAEQVRTIREMWASGKYIQKDIAAKFGIARNTVSGIVRNKSWQHLGPFVGDGVFERVPSVQLPIRGEVA